MAWVAGRLGFDDICYVHELQVMAAQVTYCEGALPSASTHSTFALLSRHHVIFYTAKRAGPSEGFMRLAPIGIPIGESDFKIPRRLTWQLPLNGAETG